MKVRADTLLVHQNLAETPAQAAALIMAGAVLADDKPVRKAGELLPDTAILRVKGKGHNWVGRGALKLDHGLTYFNLDVTGLVGLDVGSSTGGFTEVLLARGAARVYAVDVGTNQLAWKLRQDARVVSLEQTDARRLTTSLIPEPPQIVVCDASFIGLREVLPTALGLAASGATLVALIKPQFEARPAQVGPGGIVTDPALQAEICAGIATWLNESGWPVLGQTESPIKGTDGNREFLIAARKLANNIEI
jgi:23S rRNA (cytidine1920-2'-O)/16S rRNA (cytidine1409-2'-O)-methyltransferase